MRGEEQFIHGQKELDQEKSQKSWKWYQWIRLIGITMAVYVTMEYVLPVVFPFCIGFLLALLLDPLCRLLERRLHMRREPASFLSMGLFAAALLLALSALALLLFWAGRHVVSSGLPELLSLRGRRMWNLCCDRLHTLTGSWFLKPEGYEPFLERLRAQLFPTQTAWMDGIAPVFFKSLAYILVTVVSAMLMLAELDAVKGWLRVLSGRLLHRGFGSSLGKVGWTYVRAQLLIMGAVTSICVLGLLAARVRGWLLIGIGIGICDALPFLGTGICFLPWALWRLLNRQYVSFAWFLALYVLTSMTRQLLEPRLIGKRIGVPPLLILVSVYVGVKVYSRCGFLLGPISAFLIWQISSDKVEMEDAYESEGTGTPGDDKI